MNKVDTTAGRAKSGIWGLDNILSGGFSRGHIFLVEGAPGTGKTTVALQFLLEGIKAGEKCLYVTLSETERELRDGAASHGWSLDNGIEVFELLPPESLLDSEQQQSLLYSSDLELGETTKQIFEAVERARPDRVVLDSLSEIRLLAQSSLRYRRQILAIKHYFAKYNTTVMMLDDLTAEIADKTVHSVAHGVLRLEELAPAYGAERRRVRVIKYRGVKFRGGYHDVTITTGGMNVFPRQFYPQHVVERHSGTRPVAGRRRRDRFEHVGARSGRHRQVTRRHHLHCCSGQARRKGGAVRVR
jgi:circadian clock protein KaiC